MNRNILEEFKIRNILKNTSNDEKILKACNEGAGIYIGFDPTSDSLHIGHLIQLLLLKRFSKFGLKPIIVIGGGTGKIGDPSFKKDERPLLNNETVKNNIDQIKKQITSFLPNIKIINNDDWLSDQSMIDFLRNIGKRYTLSYLLSKECISSRIEKGLSVTEFFYTMLQGFDFYQLYIKYNCWLQCGGSDQWGNITSGLDLINSIIGKDKSNAAGLTTNLMLKKNGIKFGKTENGAIWLDNKKTSDYEFYQFFLNQNDDDCLIQLNWLSDLSFEQIQEMNDDSKQNPSQKIMQRQLATEITKFIRGKSGLENAIKVSEALFKNDIHSLDKETIKLLSGIPITKCSNNLTIIDFLVKNNICPSNREARLMIKDKSVSINGKTIENETDIISDKNSLFSKYFIVKKGKKNFYKVILDN